MRHIYIRGLLSVVWFAAAILSGMNPLYIIMGILFFRSAYSAWKKEKDDEGGK